MRPRETIPYTESKAFGRLLLRPIMDDVPEPDGWDSVLEDEYLPGATAWHFSRRVRKFWPKPCDCASCLEGRKVDRKDEILLTEADLASL